MRVCAATLREEVAAILRAAGASALFVTHDQQEALSLADVVVVMRDGRVEQTGRPEEIYSRPTSRWIAEFLGDAKVLPGTAANGVVECELGSFPTERSFVGAVDVVVRPELLSISAGNGSAGAGGAGVPAVSSIGRTSATTRWSSSNCRVGSTCAAGAWAPRCGTRATKSESR